MRKVILTMHISLDGFVGGPNGELDWVTMSEEIDDSSLPELIERADTCLLGRVLYQGFYSYWPDAPAKNPNLSKSEVEFSKWIDQAHKVVFSTTLDKAEWNNSRLVRTDIAGEVRRLKEQPGKDMLVFGGARFARELVRQGLVDVYDLMLNPVILGAGLPLFGEGTARQKLKLASCKAFGDTAAALRWMAEDSSGE